MLNQKIFVNRILNMKKIKFIGLDMDHTLVRYKVENSESLVYKYTIEKLIQAKGYPTRIRALKFQFNEAIRGLVIDAENGNILKLSRFGAIRKSYHGTKLMSFEEAKEKYLSIYVDLHDPNYLAIDTYFSISLCVLYGQLVDIKDQFPEELPDYKVIAYDILKSIDLVHQEGLLKEEITNNLDEYIYQDKLVVEGLKRYRNYGKKFFILTNSDYLYTDKLLKFAIEPFLEKGEKWYDLFEYVITLAQKPLFFYDKRLFLKIDPKTGLMSNLNGKMIQPGIYQGGCAEKFTEALNVNTDEILYIGDHIYGDILRLKKDCKWRTALVIEELGEEIHAQRSALPIEKRIDEYMEIKTLLEKKYVDVCSTQIEAGFCESDSKEALDLQAKTKSIDNKISVLIKKQNQHFNKKWDKIFRAGAEESYFAYQVDRFACIYMEKISDLLQHPPITYFRASHRLLAHDIDLNRLL
jgi:HAD superfamily 5'-nucleotidase-like hydrolase